MPINPPPLPVACTVAVGPHDGFFSSPYDTPAAAGVGTHSINGGGRGARGGTTGTPPGGEGPAACQVVVCYTPQPSLAAPSQPCCVVSGLDTAAVSAWRTRLPALPQQLWAPGLAQKATAAAASAQGAFCLSPSGFPAAGQRHGGLPDPSTSPAEALQSLAGPSRFAQECAGDGSLAERQRQLSAVAGAGAGSDSAPAAAGGSSYQGSAGGGAAAGGAEADAALLPSTCRASHAFVLEFPLAVASASAAAAGRASSDNTAQLAGGTPHARLQLRLIGPVGPVRVGRPVTLAWQLLRAWGPPAVAAHAGQSAEAGHGQAGDSLWYEVVAVPGSSHAWHFGACGSKGLVSCSNNGILVLNKVLQPSISPPRPPQCTSSQ